MWSGAASPAKGGGEAEASQELITLAFLLLLGLPAVSCIWLSLQTSVLYWIGSYGFVATVGVLLWILMFHNFFIRNAIQRRPAISLAFAFPAFALMIISHMHKVMATNAHTQLVMQDCESFPEKLRLEHAWQEASQLMERCVGYQVNMTSAPRDEVRQVMSLERCPGYERGRRGWEKEWDYLKSLEMEQRCGGWCETDRPLWVTFTGAARYDRCSHAAAELLGGIVHRTARQAFIYSAMIMIVVGILLSIIVV